MSKYPNSLSCVLEVKDGQKRRRLEAAGRENHSPKQSSRLQAEPVIKPDTPIIPSVRSRVLQLTQRREGNPVFTFEPGLLTLCSPNYQ